MTVCECLQHLMMRGIAFSCMQASIQSAHLTSHTLTGVPHPVMEKPRLLNVAIKREQSQNRF